MQANDQCDQVLYGPRQIVEQLAWYALPKNLIAAVCRIVSQVELTARRRSPKDPEALLTKVHHRVEVKPNFLRERGRAIDCMAWFSDGNSEMRIGFDESLTKLDLPFLFLFSRDYNCGRDRCYQACEL